VLFLPGGLVSLPEKLRGLWQRFRPTHTPASAA
jgi:hypothetical protein